VSYEPQQAKIRVQENRSIWSQKLFARPASADTHTNAVQFRTQRGLTFASWLQVSKLASLSPTEVICPTATRLLALRVLAICAREKDVKHRRWRNAAIVLQRERPLNTCAATAVLDIPRPEVLFVRRAVLWFCLCGCLR
jgi:hypothetical protein